MISGKSIKKSLTCLTRFLDVLTRNIPTVLSPFSSKYRVHVRTIDGTCCIWLWTPAMFVISSSSWLLRRSMFVWESGRNVLCKYSANSVLAGSESHEPDRSRCCRSRSELNELRELRDSFFSFMRLWSFSMHCSNGMPNMRPPFWCTFKASLLRTLRERKILMKGARNERKRREIMRYLL